MTSFTIDDKTLLVYESRQTLIASITSHLKDLHHTYLHSADTVFWIDEDEVLLDIVRSYAMSCADVSVKVFMSTDAMEHRKITTGDTCQSINMSFNNHIEDTNIDVFLLSSGIPACEPPVGTKLVDCYWKMLQTAPERVLTVFSGERCESSCYQAVVIKQCNQLGIKNYPRVLYCDIYACGAIKCLVSQRILMSQTTVQDALISPKGCIPSHNNYHYRIVLACSTPPYAIKIADTIRKEIFAQIASQVYNVTEPSFFTGSRVLLFSPHPDDDVIAAGLGLQHLNNQDVVLHVAYCVAGYNSVRDKYLEHVPETSIDLRIEKTKVRENEAKRALEVIGLSEKHVHFLRLPFYDNNHGHGRRIYDHSDVQIVADLIAKVRPDHIFMAGDLADPHQTHELCYNIIKDAIEALDPKLYQQLKDGSIAPLVSKYIKDKKNCPNLTIDDIQSAIHGPMNFIQCRAIQPYNVIKTIRDAISGITQLDIPTIWLYRGSWNRFTLGEASLTICGTRDEVNKKGRAIRAHASQMGKAMFMGGDARSFDMRAHDLCISAAAQLSNLTASTAYGAEHYVCSLVLL